MQGHICRGKGRCYSKRKADLQRPLFNDSVIYRLQQEDFTIFIYLRTAFFKYLYCAYTVEYIRPTDLRIAMLGNASIYLGTLVRKSPRTQISDS